jgi:AraC family transcriptional regulator of adaptative response/methylated-DNA-[protein]-cysteine methyltransferase
MSPLVLPISTSHGTFLAHYSESGLAALDFPRTEREREPSSPIEYPARILVWHDLTSRALHAVLEGIRIEALPPLDATGTAFQKSVWKLMQSLPPGSTMSYGEVAAKLGKPGASRAVGSACGANPIPVLVPCHRILASNGKLGGFSGGLDWKRKLLSIEGLHF